MVYWYEGYCQNCGKVVRGRILDDDTITVDVVETDDGWFDDSEKCDNPVVVIQTIRDVD